MALKYKTYKQSAEAYQRHQQSWGSKPKSQQVGPHHKCPAKAIKLQNKAHYAELICTTHNRHIQWLSRRQFHLTRQHLPKAIGESGIKERSLRPSPRKKILKFQKRLGNTQKFRNWKYMTEYQFVQ